ncbi:hypothetical protein [Massilia sp. YIM B02443]|uniref:hypothetical protein n=1 Tax=Massilia sp. YIM B02443 TaxID=3050127 RepID=UPI0025B6BAE5|nr:hypothetical protein [Massilia sp. YIM B02443]MDN4035943.1 hypothetical protein [Massilia sp. YIM B02443]
MPLEIGLDKLGIGIVLYAYAVLLGACYIFSFWRPFGFNIFPYLGLQDYISTPLNRVVVIVAVPVVVAAIYVMVQERGRDSIRNVMRVLVLLYAISFAVDFYKGVSAYLALDFHFENETSLLVIAFVMFVGGIVLSIYRARLLPEFTAQFCALVLAQSAASMAAGYSDGKGLYNGALQVHFLENKDLCEQGGIRDWVFLGAFGDRTFFMNTIDKRLCVTDEKKIRLISRQVREQL